MAQQLFADINSDIVQDNDQFWNKRPGTMDAAFAWHPAMAYWPSPETLEVDQTDTCTFSLAVDDSEEANGCLRYVAWSGVTQCWRPHWPARSRDEGHAPTAVVSDEELRGGSGGKACPDRPRRTYVIAHRDRAIVDAERAIGFTHSHNDDGVNWDTIADHCRNQDKER